MSKREDNETILEYLQRKHGFSDEAKKDLKGWGRVLLTLGLIFGGIVGFALAVFLC